MSDKLHNKFSKNSFDVYEPHSGHLERFQRKLHYSKREKTNSWKWMSIAASIVLLIGFYLGSYHQKKQYDLKDVSPKMAEAQTFFITTINQELKEIEKHRNLDTEKIIEDALDEIEELEDEYNTFIKELNTNENKRNAIQAMIGNYQQRLEVLEKLFSQLKTQNNLIQLDIENDEII